MVSSLDPETWLVLDDKQSATLINNFFVSLTKDFSQIKSEWFDLECSESLPPVSIEDVQIELTKMNTNKSPGPNDPFMKILKLFANSFAVPLAELYNKSFRYKYFPEIWKQYRIAAIPKVVPCTVVENTRPIALTSVLSKIQESFAVKWINEDIEDKIFDSQYGGIRGSSTVLALLNLIHKWYKAMDIPQRVIRIVSLDFRKAFDLIDHNVLLENMRTIGVRQSLIKWFAKYLKNRSHFTAVKEDESEYQYVNGGVPQGSKVGPIAFIIQINQLPSVIRDEMNLILATNNEGHVVIEDETMFMDDTTMFEVLDVSGHISGTEIGGLPSMVNKVQKFTIEEKMELNLKKYKEMIIDFVGTKPSFCQ